MKTISAKKYLLGVLVLPAFISGIAFAHDVVEGQDGHDGPGYVIDGSGMVVRNSDPDSLCWRTGYWEKEMATEACDPDLVEKPEQVAEAPAEPAPTPPEKITFSADALFDFDSATLKPEGKMALDDFANKLANLNYDLIIAVGYADRIGNEDYNQKLSLRRAESVKEYLVDNKGIDPNRVFTDGKGEANPVTGDTCQGNRATRALIECLAPDRRVEIEVAGTR